jgi:hypothetical protein
MKFWRQFVAVLKDAELSCTTISDIAKGMISLSKVQLQIK